MTSIHVKYSDSLGTEIESDVTSEIVQKIKSLLNLGIVNNDIDKKRLETNRKQREAYKNRKNNDIFVDNAYIYILKFGSNTYIGHTTLGLKVRMLIHINLSKQYEKKNKKNTFYNTLFSYSKSDIEIDQLEHFPSISKIELLFKEDYYINKLNPNMNSRSAVNSRLKKKYPEYIVDSD